jgi:hypothetical protein
VQGAEAQEMRAFSSFCDAAIAEKRPILKGQANGCNLRRQTARTGYSPSFAPFLAYFCPLHAIEPELKGLDPSRQGQKLRHGFLCLDLIAIRVEPP